MKSRQAGVSLGALIVGLFVLIVVGIFSMKLIPSYLEFRNAKTVIQTIAREKQSSTVAEIRKTFDARATVDDITTIKGADLEITKEGGEVVISFGYRKEVPIAGSLGVYIDYAANSKED
jgi:hypothetical protein